MRRALLLLIGILMALLAPRAAAASTPRESQTRVWASELDIAYCTYRLVDPTLRIPSRTSAPSLRLASDPSLRWKGMWRFEVAGTELYDARARMWSPALGSFLSVDEYDFHDPNTTLWAWPGQNPLRWSDPFGRGRGAEDSRSAFTQALFDLSPNQLDGTAGFGTGLLDNIPLFPIHGSPTLGSLAAAGGLAGQHPARAGACVGGGGGNNNAGNIGRAAGGVAGAIVIGAGAARLTASTAKSAIALAKQLASEAQLGEMAAGAGRQIAGAGTDVAFRDAARIADTYGGNAADWVKMSSSGYHAADGTTFATHWVENLATGQQAEAKVVIDIFGGP